MIFTLRKLKLAHHLYSNFQRSIVNLTPQTRPKMSQKMTRGTLNLEKIKLDRQKYIEMDPKEKRKLYKTKRPLTLDDIPTWPRYYAENKLNPENTGYLNSHKSQSKFTHY